MFPPDTALARLLPSIPNMDTLETWLVLAEARLERQRVGSPDDAWQANLEQDILTHLVTDFHVEERQARDDLAGELAFRPDPIPYLTELLLRQRLLIHFGQASWAAPMIQGKA